MAFIVIHTAQHQLAFYAHNRLIRRYPIAIGKPETPTPHGHYTIAHKSLYPGGVFGSRWLGLSLPKYGIHGTNDPSSIGKSVSLGCIRMHNKDVEQLYTMLPIGAPVVIRD
ncbi:MAG: L,D-transpeptidase [Peptococcaceae bacterium]|jgi:lipoprotein-anchoring transpeptidase ErfK/SrfK|nr:L,D-transpeptidase [Peptococcaceae bacterium]